jgi:hypothetical protein
MMKIILVSGEYISSNGPIGENGGRNYMGRIITAIFSTILGGIFASFLEPPVFANSIPLAIMGGFILAEIQRKTDK